MSCYSKEKSERNDQNNICKSHSARTDRGELYRICPSKLSKRELEDLYFSLLENNLEMKKTINGQQDQIRGLSTKMQRMTAAQKALQGKEMKECCIGTKSVVSEQKESLTELKRANQRMAERIRTLNMRLCSAKQFYKKAPQMSNSRCIRCVGQSTPKKHSCLDKQSEPVLKLSTSCQYVDRDTVSMKSAQTETRDLEKQNEEVPCDENKCRTLMEELKLKIVNLQEELSQVHEEYSGRIGRLEAEVSQVRRDNALVAGQRRASDHQLQRAAADNAALMAELRTTEGTCAELSTQLSIEKRKVAELETRLKAADISDRVNKTIEDHSTPKLNGSKDGPCPCPAEPIVATASKSPFARFSLLKSKSSKSSKAVPITNSKNVHCGCPAEKQSELTQPSTKAKNVMCACAPPEEMSTPIKAKKCVSCACPVWNDNEIYQSTPTKADMAGSGPTKDTKCDNCCCMLRTEGERFECAAIKTGTDSSPKVADTRTSPGAYHEDGKISKASDDSGYMDVNRSQDTPDEAGLNKVNKELVKKILELQSQLDSMKVAGASELPEAKQYKLSENDRTSFSGVTPSTAKSAAVKSGTISENHKRTDILESSQSDTSMTKSPKSDVRPDKLFLGLSEIREANEGTARNLTPAIEERRFSKSNGQTSNGRKTTNERTNGHRHSDEIKLVHGKVEKPPVEEREPELTLDKKSEFVSGNIDLPIDEQRASHLYFGNKKIAINDYDDGNKAELIPIKLKYTDFSENRRLSDIGDTAPKTAIYGDPVPTKTELFNNQPQVEMTEERNISQKLERVPTDLTVMHDSIKQPQDVLAKNESGKPAAERRLSEQDPTTSKENCQYCPACTYEAECAAQPYVNTLDPKNNDPSAKTGQAMKSDQHNSLQIPGPIPTTNTNNKDWKKNAFTRHFSIDKRRDSKASKTAKQKKQSNKENKEDKEKEMAELREKLKETYETTSGPIHLADVPVLYSNKNIGTRMKEETEFLNNDVRRRDSNTSKDSMNMRSKRLSNTADDLMIKDSGAPVQDANVSMQNYYNHSDNLVRSMSMQYNTQAQGTQIENNTDENNREPTVPANNVEALGAPRASVSGRRRDVSVYRRQSGTLCFRTAPADASPPSCHCERRPDARCVGKLENKGTQAQVEDEKTPNNQRRLSTSEQGTYTVGTKQNRSTSPDSTDIEMSYMPDLPYEKDADKKPVQSPSLSPGENKMTTTYTDSYCSPATNYSLSEGEVPTTSARKMSYGNDKEKTTPTKPTQQEVMSTQSMEAALQAISDELARCKTLLGSQRPAEQKRCGGSTDQSPLADTSYQSQTSMPDSNRPIALRPGVATQSIGDTYVPKCIFTLHIGTVVLSDEAVLSSRNKNLLLMWKFYDQNVAMTRMRAGRVVLFDFSTEYDIKITDDFLRYLKHAELPIIICELDKEHEPFATCSLPLRDALLHTNRRADMSLALVAGPQMISARAANGAAADALDGRDEMGVIDLWCMLRADANMLPGINLAISQPPTSPTATKRHHSRVMQQVLDDDHSNECADLDLTLEKRNALPVSVNDKTGKNVCQDVEFTRTSHYWSKPMHLHSIPTTSKAEEEYDASKYPPVRSRSNSALHNAPAGEPVTAEPRQDLLPEHDGSRIIISEVKAKIRTPSDMKQALDRSSFQTEYSRIPKTEEETSQAHSSLGSSRSFFARLQRRGSPRSDQKRDSIRTTMLEGVRRGSKCTLDTPIRMKEKEESDLEIYKRYENISKLIGSNRAESKKCVTIVPKYIEPVLDEPQRLSPSQDTFNPQTPDDDKDRNIQSLDITVLWLALNEECEAMVDPHVQRLYVAYSFLGRSGADLETPVSLPKPKHYVDKCYFNFKKTFDLEDSDLPILGHMARCRTGSKASENEKDCIIFSVVSEPSEDPLGLENCEDIGYAYLYLGDLLAYSAGSSTYTEVIPVRGAGGAAAVCGVLAVRLDGLDVVRRCLRLSGSHSNLADWSIR